MRKTTILLGCILLAVIGIAGCGTAKPDLKSENNIELNVSAAVSLKDALEEIKKEYEKKHPHVKIIYNLGASGSLQKQIEQGAPADLFISEYGEGSANNKYFEIYNGTPHAIDLSAYVIKMSYNGGGWPVDQTSVYYLHKFLYLSEI